MPDETSTNRILPQYEHVSSHDLSEAVHQALGAASVCWEPMNGTGIFESERAEQIGAELLGIIGQFAQGSAQSGDGKVTVDREDLRAYLDATMGGDPNLRDLWECLAAAAGVKTGE